MRSLLVAVLVLVADVAFARSSHEGWVFNFTPAVVSQDESYRFGWGVDPELRYSFSVGGSYLSLGARVAGYDAKNRVGWMAMPTLRLAEPLGAFDAYLAAGYGQGSIPELEHSANAEMYRAGFFYHFSDRIGIGVEGTYQKIANSNFEFFSMGSMIAFEL
jgi:hypothetical protein